MSEKKQITVLPVARQKNMVYYVGSDGYVYEANAGNRGRPKKKMPKITDMVEVIDADKQTSEG